MDAETVVRSYLTAGDAGAECTLAELVAKDVVTHAPGRVTITGREATIATWRAARGGLSQLSHRVMEMVTRGDTVAVRVEVSGLHTGTFLGVPPTGARVTVDQALFIRLEEGRIVEMWEIVDTAAGLQQLGALGPRQLSPGG